MERGKEQQAGARTHPVAFYRNHCGHIAKGRRNPAALFGNHHGQKGPFTSTKRGTMAYDDTISFQTKVVSFEKRL
jgi:hypothetical protein